MTLGWIITFLILYVFWSVLSIKDLIDWWRCDGYMELEHYTVYWAVFSFAICVIFFSYYTRTHS